MFYPAYIGYHDESPEKHINFALDNWQNYRPRSLSMYGSLNHPLVAAIWVQLQPWEPQYEYDWFPKGNKNELNTYIIEMRKKGFFPLHIAATTDGPYAGALSVVYTAIFQKAIVPTDMNFTYELSQLPNSLGSAVSNAVNSGMYLSSVCPIGRVTNNNAAPGYRYATVFRPQPPARHISWLWYEQAPSEMGKILTAARSGMFRPTMLAPILDTAGNLAVYSVVWRDDSLVDWPSGPLGDKGFDCGVFVLDNVEAGTDTQGYQAFFDKCTDTGKWVLEVAAAGVTGVGPGPRFVAVGATYPYDRPAKRQWTIARTVGGSVSPSPPGGFNPNVPPPGGIQNGPLAVGDEVDLAIPKNLDPWDKLMTRAMVVDDVRGAQLAIVRDGKLAVLRSYTNAEKGYPVVKHTDCFRLASASKVITAMAILRLGALESADPTLLLDAPVAARLMIPNYSNPSTAETYMQQMTVDNLITYLAGLNDKPTLVYANSSLPPPLGILPIVQYLRSLTDTALQQDLLNTKNTPIFDHAPATTSKYSNFSFVMAQAIVELGSQQGGAYIPFTQSALFQPLQPSYGFKAHRAQNTLNQAEKLDEVRFHSRKPKIEFSDQDADTKLYRPNNYHFPLDLSGDGGWSMPAIELARLLAALDREYKSKTPAERELILTVFTDGINTFGRGWDQVWNFNGIANAFAYHKNGAGDACGSVIYYRPEVPGSPSLGIVMLFNKDLSPSFVSQSVVQQVEVIASKLNPNQWPTEDLFHEFSL